MFGIEGIEIYFPKTYVDQSEYCNFMLTQKLLRMPEKESILKGLANSNYRSLMRVKM